MDELTLIQRMAVWALPAIMAITGHEVAHGWMAKRLGDPTAMMLGRLTLNPIKHIDPLGTLLIPALMLTFGGFLFGWAKPVPVTWENLRQPKRDMALVALAGPMANLVMALLWVVVVAIALHTGEGERTISLFFIYSGVAGVIINTLLMIFNLLPLPPLDGGRILVSLLPGPWAWKVSRLEPWGLPILILLLMSGLLSKVMGPLIITTMALLLALSGMSSDGFQHIFFTLMG